MQKQAEQAGAHSEGEPRTLLILGRATKDCASSSNGARRCSARELWQLCRASLYSLRTAIALAAALLKHLVVVARSRTQALAKQKGPRAYVSSTKTTKTGSSECWWLAIDRELFPR